MAGIEIFQTIVTKMKKLRTEDIPRLNKEAFKSSTKLPVAIVLDNIRSHHNVGAFFRTADAFRFSQLILTGITGCPPHRDIRKTALGSTETVDWKYVKDTLDAVKQRKSCGFKLIAVEICSKGTALQDIHLDTNTPVAIIFGNEVHGVQQSVIDMCDACLEIPQAGTKHSLNVSVSGGIVMWEVFKQLYL
jgi:23S rRNA (guanosine2251-2'-O)-methyltransferase